MQITTLLALGMAAYAIFSGRKMQEKLQDAFDGVDSRADEALNQAAITAALVQGEASDLAISVRLSISSIGDTLWNGYVTWTITNKSQAQNYYIRDIQSRLVLCGHQMDNWLPGNRNLTYIKAGQTVKINSSINDHKFWINPQICKDVREQIKNRLGVKVLSSIKFPVPAEDISDLLTVDSTTLDFSSGYSDNSKYVRITNELPCALAYPAYAKVYEKDGSNALDWK